MAITTYAELQTAIDNWLGTRGDLTARITEFITLAEDEIELDLNAKDLEKRSTTTTSDEYIDFPSGFISPVRLHINSDPVRRLEYKPPDMIEHLYSTESASKPFVYTIIGNKIQVRPVPDTSYTYEMAYKYKIDRLSTANTSNWLLTNYPSAYLYAAMVQADRFTRDMERIDDDYALYQKIMDKLLTKEKKGFKAHGRMTPDIEVV